MNRFRKTQIPELNRISKCHRYLKWLRYLRCLDLKFNLQLIIYNLRNWGQQQTYQTRLHTNRSLRPTRQRCSKSNFQYSTNRQLTQSLLHESPIPSSNNSSQCNHNICKTKIDDAPFYVKINHLNIFFGRLLEKVVMTIRINSIPIHIVFPYWSYHSISSGNLSVCSCILRWYWWFRSFHILSHVLAWHNTSSSF